jgi:uncharacterized protein (DUF362 family)
MVEGSHSEIFQIKNCPKPEGAGDHHEGVDSLLRLMADNGLKFYRTHEDTDLGGPTGLIDTSDVVLVKVNAQWKYRGCTNSDVVRGLIQRILEHPDGFSGEVVIFENGQSGGSLDCDTMWGRQYTDTGVHANAEDESHSFSYLVDKVFADDRVSMYLLDPVRETFIDDDDHSTDGYRRTGEVSYPCFTTTKGNRVELKEGIWNGSGHDDGLKLVNVPVLKHHDGCGVTGAVKSYYGILSMADGWRRERHYEKLGAHCGEMIANVRAPVLNVLDCIWVTQVKWAGYPPENTTRLDQLLASLDPVALDYWASKHLLYPIDGNEEHNPDEYRPLRDYLTQVRDLVNAGGGISGHEVTLDESLIDVYSSVCD